MQSHDWIALFRRIPPAQHNTLVVLTTAGIEITIQAVLRLEDQYLVLRGRLSGTTDNGRVFFLPYGQMNYLGFQKELKEADVRALYGEPEPSAVPAAANGTVAPPDEEPSDASDAPAVLAAPAEPVLPEAPRSESRLSIPRKSGILARLRARRDGAGELKPPAKP